jgi:hypothetical protein
MGIRVKKLNWEPVRYEAVYCAPACGRGCTFEEFTQAQEQASNLAKELGNGWIGEVHENLGWHWNIRWGKPGYGMVLYKYAYNLFLAGIESNGYAHAMSFSANGSTPREAIRNVLTKVQSIVDTYTKIIKAVEKV